MLDVIARLRVFSAIALVFLGGCAAESRELPRAASMPAPAPVMLPSAPHRVCDPPTLARASLWAGTIVSRVSMQQQAIATRVVYDRTARCDGLELASCREWAWQQLRGVETRSEGGELERRVESGAEFRGTMWNLVVDGEKQDHLLRTNRDFAALLRRLEASGKQVQVTERQRVIEPRFGRIHLTMVAAEIHSVPAERWTVEFDASELGVLEVGLALDDLDELGVRVSDRSEFDRRAREVTPIATSATVTTLVSEESAGRERADVVVMCDHEQPSQPSLEK
jgi:hypothetical protein